MGHPKIIRYDFDETQDAYFGVITVLILPPKDLLHPVLPVKIKMGKEGEKLVFSLCRMCVEKSNYKINSCDHSDIERSFEGAWISPEFYKALEKGYRVLEWLEVWHYPVKIEGLYSEYVKMWFKMKAEAKGWPKEDMSDDEKIESIQEFKEKNDGILLDISKIESNKTRYMIAKLLLNSLWGGWCKNPFKAKQRNHYEFR